MMGVLVAVVGSFIAGVIVGWFGCLYKPVAEQIFESIDTKEFRRVDAVGVDNEQKEEMDEDEEENCNGY